MTSYQPVSSLMLGHGLDGQREQHTTAQQKTLRSSRSAASILHPLASIADTIDSLYNFVSPPSVSTKHIDHAALALKRPLPENVEHLSLQSKLQTAKHYEEWEEAALRLDEYEGHDVWKSAEDCADYDVQVLREKLSEIERVRGSCDLKDMLMLVRTTLHRDMAGIGNPLLYRQSRIGTKDLIERYITAAVDLVETTIHLTAQGGYPLPWSIDKMREMWLHTRQAFGRTALLLSGGGTLGMCHVGVVKALYETDALPRIISGTSAGSIVAAVCCCKTAEEIPGLLRDFCYGELDVFFRKEEEGQKYSNMAKHFLTQGNLYDIQNLNRVMKIYVGDMTFLEAYNRTNRILNICVSNEDPREKLSVLNYVTSPNVLIWSAVAASCSVPLIYSPAKLYEKHPRTGEMVESSQSWIDGSMNGDVPMERLSELFDVNHFIVSQVNPHIMPFLPKDDDIPSESVQDQAPAIKDIVFGMAKEELLFRLKMSAEVGLFPTASIRLRALISQTYQGDINIVPQVGRANYLRILSNPTPDFMLEACDAGERATWPKVNRIRTRCAIENAIERAVKEACNYAEFSDSKVALRRNVYHKSASQAALQNGMKRSASKGAQSIASAIERPNSRKGHGHRSTRSLHERVPLHAQWDASSLNRPPSSHADGEESDTVGESSASDAGLFSKDETEQTDTDLESDLTPVDEPTMKWSKMARFQASKSQPTTPSLASRSFGHMTSSNTGTKRQSPAEATYKRIFHGAKKQLATIPSVSQLRASGSTSPPPQASISPNSLPRTNSRLKLSLSLKSSQGTKSAGSKRAKA